VERGDGQEHKAAAAGGAEDPGLGETGFQRHGFDVGRAKPGLVSRGMTVGGSGGSVEEVGDEEAAGEEGGAGGCQELGGVGAAVMGEQNAARKNGAGASWA